MQRRLLFFFTLLTMSVLVACGGAGAERTQTEATPASAASLKLLTTVDEQAAIRVQPGTGKEAIEYYDEIGKAFGKFPKPSLRESFIADMLAYYGFPALLAEDLQRLDPAVLMDFAQLKDAVTNKPEFEEAYRSQPLRPGEILASRFFAPKIINVRDPFDAGVPKGGFGWRKLLRFKARDGSNARDSELDSFYLLFNFTSGANPKFPEGVPAGQIQALLVPVYPPSGHRDIYFLVYKGLASSPPEERGKVGLFLEAAFDLVQVVPKGEYYVPRSCAQCHGTEAPNQVGGKVNYLDTDHWLDSTGTDFTIVQKDDVLVDPKPYDTIRRLNEEIERQNLAVAGTGPRFAPLAARKWLDLHLPGSLGENQHIPPLSRGFVENAGDPEWSGENPVDAELLPLLNHYCFRCHSSVRFHVFEKKAVIERKGSIGRRLRPTANPTQVNMPQGRDLTPEVRAKLIELVGKLSSH